jgi:hypothetical protein
VTYRVAWGPGRSPLAHKTLKSAVRRVRFLNAAYPEGEHWVEDEDGRRVEVEEEGE